MGVDGLENLTSDDDNTEDAPRLSDAEVKAVQENELQAERDYRRDRLGHQGPGAAPAPGYVTSQPPVEPETFQTDGADPDADETVADYDAEETEDDEETEA